MKQCNLDECPLCETTTRHPETGNTDTTRVTVEAKVVEFSDGSTIGKLYWHCRTCGFYWLHTEPQQDEIGRNYCLSCRKEIPTESGQLCGACGDNKGGE